MGKSGRETPINSADSRRVDTEDRRRWCELRFEDDATAVLAFANDDEMLPELLIVEALAEDDNDPKEKDAMSLRPEDLEEEREAAMEDEEEMEVVREWERLCLCPVGPP